MRNYNYFDGRRITENGFTTAKTTDGKTAMFVTKDGSLSPVMMGISEFGKPGIREFIRGDVAGKSHKVPAYVILWLGDANGPSKGVTIDAEMYREAVADPEKHQDRIQRLQEWNVPLNICLD